MEQEKAIQGNIFDINRFALYDGPGIRTTVFLKGCPLHCAWCHNPESISSAPELLFVEDRCIGCRECLKVCPSGAHEFNNGRHTINRALCQNCGACVKVCLTGALKRAGRRVTVQEVLEVVIRDEPFYESSDGGITLSGGEPLMQPEFALALLRQMKKQSLHTALDTSGYASWKSVEQLLPFTDLVLYDLKHMDSEQHRRITGVSNRRILNNLFLLDQAKKPLWIRLPLVPGYNDEEVNYHALGSFLSKLNHIERIEILPYHRFAQSKYVQMGIEYPLRKVPVPEQALVESRRQILLEYGLTQTFVSTDVATG